MTQKKHDNSFVPLAVCAAVVALVTFIVFSGGLRADFLLWDDDIAILYNYNLRKEGILWMFGELDTTQRYNPLTFLVWSLVYHLAGYNPQWFHFVSVLYHAMSTLCLYLSLRELLKISAQQGRLHNLNQRSLEMASVAGALVWALHPLRVEVVALAATTTYCQSAFFLMGSLLFYLKAQQVLWSGRYPVFIGMSLLCYLCSLLTYPLGMTFFLVFLVMDIYLLRRVDFSDVKNRWQQLRAVLLEKLFFGLPAVAVAFAAVMVRHRPSTVWESPVALADFGIIDRAMQAFYILAYYLWKPFYPIKLAPIYMTLVSFDPYAPSFVLSLLVILGITIFCILMRKRLPILMGLWICYIVLQLPFLGLFEHPHFHSDRYSLLSSLVFSVLAAILIVRVLAVFGTWRVTACMLIMLSVLGWLSVKQVAIWKNSEVFFNYIIRHLGEDPYRIEILGKLVRYYQQTGETEKSVQTLHRILAIKPQSLLAHRQLATIYINTGRFAEALPHFESILAKEPSDFAMRYNFGIALLKVGRKDEAAEQFQYAESLKIVNRK